MSTWRLGAAVHGEAYSDVHGRVAYDLPAGELEARSEQEEEILSRVLVPAGLAELVEQSPAPVLDEQYVRSLRKDELVDLAAEHGVASDGTKGDVADRLVDALGLGAPTEESE